MDDDGMGTVDIPIKLEVSIEDDVIHFDFTGTGKQVAGNIIEVAWGLSELSNRSAMIASSTERAKDFTTLHGDCSAAAKANPANSFRKTRPESPGVSQTSQSG